MTSVLTHPSFRRRVRHQLAHEWRHQRGLVLLEWLSLVLACFETLREKPQDAALPVTVPALLALVIVARSVRADAPGNTEAASHTRPAGRSAVWAGKVVFFTLALLLPWVAHGLPQFAGYGFGFQEWLGLLMEGFLPAALLGTMAAGLISHANSTRQNIVLSFVALLLAWGLSWVLDDSEWNQARRCGAAVAGVVLLGFLLMAWWQSVQLRPRASWLWLVGGLVLVSPLPFVWKWDWRALPLLSYAETKLTLHIGTKPGEPSQELWRGLHVLGLPPDYVASVIALAPVPKGTAKWPPQDVISSDYTSVNETTREEESLWRWMREDHVAAIAPHYPADSLLHGNPAEDVRGPEMPNLVAYTEAGDADAMKRPWRLRLAVQKMQRVFSKPMLEVIREPQSIHPRTGYRLDFWLKKLDHSINGGQLDMAAMLRRRFPLLVPDGRHARPRPLGYLAVENFLPVLHSPALGEICVSREAEDQFSYRDTLLLARNDRPAGFDFAHPVPHMDIAGLTLEQWVKSSTLDLWWPEQRGVIDVEISVEDMRQVLQSR